HQGQEAMRGGATDDFDTALILQLAEGPDDIPAVTTIEMIEDALVPADVPARQAGEIRLSPAFVGGNRILNPCQHGPHVGAEVLDDCLVRQLLGQDRRDANGYME